VIKMPIQVFKSQIESEIAEKFVKTVCAARESMQHDDAKLKKSVIVALRDIKGADETFVLTILKKLRTKYPEIKFPETV